ncbi:MAG: D-alanine aminotransferase [Myxococcaceae bacterium]|nr:D-alanine aminotransferase [Myxococcaceae bacterium]
MLGIASVDGVISPLHEAHVSVLDRGFQYGDGVFEALRTYGGRADALEQHVLRLEQSCARLQITLGISRTALIAEIERAIEALPAGERYVRIMVTRGELPESLAPHMPAGPGPARRVILVRELGPAPSALYERGIRVLTRTAPTSPLWAGAKPTAYLNNLLAIGEAQRAGLDDALLLGAYGELLEGATSSAFLVRQNVLYTPPLSLGILPGITRDRVLACAAESGIEARERLLHVGDVYAADELFLTSSIRLIVAVVEVDGVRIASGAPGPITRRIDAAYRAKVERLERA